MQLLQTTLCLISLLLSIVLAFDQNTEWSQASSIYDFTVNDIDGNPVSLKKYQGHLLIITNVASKCGLSKRNYQQFEAMYEKYEAKGLRVLAFPSNQFKSTEPGNAQEIKEFVAKFGVRFDMFEKIDVNGEEAHPLYKWLKAQDLKEGERSDNIDWNYSKFIVDRNGKVVARIPANVLPNDFEEMLHKYF